MEDSLPEYRLIEMGFSKLGLNYRLQHLKNGQDALDFVHKEGSFQDAPRPDLILLDLNIPRTNGFKVLDAIKRDPELKTIPVVILSTSTHWEDIEICYESHANAYLGKDFGFKFLQTLESLSTFWFSTALLPGGKKFPPEKPQKAEPPYKPDFNIQCVNFSV